MTFKQSQKKKKKHESIYYKANMQVQGIPLYLDST